MSRPRTGAAGSDTLPAMPESLTETVDRAYAALNRRDLDAFLGFAHEDVEVISLIAESEGAVFHGHDGLREWWHQVAGSMGELTFVNEGSQELDDEHVLIRLRVTGDVNGVEIEQLMWHAIEIRDEKGTWWQAFRTEEEGLEALEARRA